VLLGGSSLALLSTPARIALAVGTRASLLHDSFTLEALGFP